MKKILLIIVMLFPFLVNASKMEQEIEILPNGDLKIREGISLDGEYNGFEMTFGYKYFDEYKIYSADSLEIVKICESNKDSTIDDIGFCFEEVEYASKGDILKYIHKVGNGEDELIFYNPSDRKKAFYIEYILKNVIVQHNDVNELRLNVLYKGLEENFDEINIKVKLSEKANDLRAWAHGPLWGEIKLDDNKEYVLFTINGYDARTAVDIRMTFDKNLVTTNKVTNENRLSSIINEETILADEANQKREEALKYLEEKEKWKQQAREWKKLRESKKKEFMFFSILWIIVAVVITVISIYKKYYKGYYREYSNGYIGKYFRDFPSNHSPEIVEYLMKSKITPVALSTSLLNIIYKKGFIVQERKIEKILSNGDKKVEEDYELILNDKELKEPLTENELQLRNLFISLFSNNKNSFSVAAVDNSYLTVENKCSFMLSDLRKPCSDVNMAKKFINGYKSWKNSIIKEVEKEKIYTDVSNKKVWLLLFGFIPLVLIIFYVEYFFIEFTLLGFLGLLFITYFYSINYLLRTKKGYELYVRWSALKNFMNDFSNFEDRELPDIKLWEKYLVYANIFGIADKLRKQMKIKVPQIGEINDELIEYNYMFRNISTNDFGTMSKGISYAIDNSVNIAVSNAKMATSSFSSGEGYGGGFSGGSSRRSSGGGSSSSRSGGGFSRGGGTGGKRF